MAAPLDGALGLLRQHGYEAHKTLTIPVPGGTETIHVIAVGLPNNRQVLLAREGADGSFRLYVLLGDTPLPAAQAQALLQWVQERVGPAPGGE